MNQLLDETSKFILQHAKDDTARLLFSKGRYPLVDMERAARCIEARRKAESKIPLWFDNPEIDYPQSLSLEQCSSQATALYKQRFVKEGSLMADLTGGLGVDCFFMSRKASKAHYCEMSEALCKAASHNFAALGALNIEVHNCEADSFLKDNDNHFDIIYADPARRGKASQRVYSITECSPDITVLKDRILSRSEAFLVKVSPMADISHTLKLFPRTREVHVLSVEGECKELLLLMKEGTPFEEPMITAAMLNKDGLATLTFRESEEKESEAFYCNDLGRYLLRPDKAVLKAGAFKLLCRRFGVRKLSGDTHLYTCDEARKDFPGRCYEIVETLPFSKKEISSIRTRYPKADLLCVNFPVPTEELRRRMGIKDGGEYFIFATTVAQRKTLIISRHNQNICCEI